MTADDTRALGWTLGLVAGLALLGKLLDAHPAASLAAQAFAAEWGAGRLGVAWSDPLGPPIEARRSLLRAFGGALLGIGAAALTLVILVVTGAAHMGPGRAPAAGLVVALVAAGLTALRDELVQRGVVIRVLRRGLPRPLLLVAVGAVAAAAHWGRASGAVPPSGLVLAGALGVAFGSAWTAERGAWTAWGAHTAWATVWSMLMTGGLLDVQLRAGPWGGGDAGPGVSFTSAGNLDGSLAAALVVSVIALGAAGVALRYRAVRDAQGTLSVS